MYNLVVVLSSNQDIVLYLLSQSYPDIYLKEKVIFKLWTVKI